MIEYEIREFIRDEISPFGEWFENLDSMAASKVTTALYRIQYGNFSNVKSIGSGVFEYKIAFRQGYRIYFGQDGKNIIILLCGGTKKKQQKDIAQAKEFWREYKNRKKSGELL